MSSTFYLSILNGQVRAAAFRRGMMAGTWDGPDSMSDFNSLSPLLRDAFARTQGEGRQVAIVLAEPRLSDQIVEIPQARSGTINRLLNRQAQRLKAFPGEAVWSCHEAMPTKKSNALLMHLCPSPLVDQLTKGCVGVQMQLVRLLPTTAVLIGQLRNLPLEKDEVAMLAAESGRSTTIVIGRGDGRVCLSRVLPNNWNTSPERVWVDLARSIGFAEQQSGLTVNSVWLFGEGAAAHLPAIQAAVKIPVKVAPGPCSAHWWLDQAFRLPERGDGNLISLEVRGAPQRRRMLTVTTMLALLLLVTAVATAGVLEALRRNELEGIASVNSHIAELRVQHADLEKSFAELERMRETIRVVQDDRVPPAPAWLLSYLGQVMPDDLALTRLRISRTNDLWSVDLSGTTQPRTNLVEILNSLSNSLAGSSIKLAVTRCGLGDAPEPAPAAPQANVTRLNPGAALRARFERGSTNTFHIHGLMK